MLSRRIERGDTLIEVLFAFAVLSLVVVGAMAIMNQGTVASQRALETTLVRDEIDAQATTLRFLHDAYITAYQPNGTYPVTTPAGQWKKLADTVTTTPVSKFGNTETCERPDKSFILNASAATYIDTPAVFTPALTFAQVVYDGTEVKESQGVWIEAVRSSASADANQQNTRYIDFHLRACWDGPGQGPPMTIGTIVRLYEPRG